jgi:WD40 repeat protein
LAAASGNHILLWDVRTGKEPTWQSGPPAVLNHLVFSPDGRVLASGALPGEPIRVWDAATGRQLQRFPGPPDKLLGFSFADNQTLLTVSHDTGVRLWDVASGRERRRLGTGNGTACQVAIAPAGDLIAVADDESLRLYATQTGEEQRRLGNTAATAKGMSFSPDGKLLAVTNLGKRIDLWDVATGRLLHQLKGHSGLRQLKGHSNLPYWLAASRGGATLVSQTETDGLIVHLWDTAARNESGRCQIAEPDATILHAISPDGRFLALVDDHSARLELWDVMVNRKIAVCQGPRDWAPQETGVHLWFRPLAFAPDGRTLATVNEEGVMQLWEVSTGEEIRHWGKPQRPGDAGGIPEEGGRVRFQNAQFLSFSPDGRSLAASDADLAYLWDVTGRAKPGAGLGHTDLKPGERDRLWQDLNQPDAAKAHRALWALVAAGDEVVPFVLEKLRPREASARHIDQLIADLDSEEYEVRQAATRELEQIGSAAELPLYGALMNRPTLETRRRIEGLLEKIEPLGRVRLPRAVAVLEQIGTPAARRALEELAKGTPRSRLVQEAWASLVRLARRR